MGKKTGKMRIQREGCRYCDGDVYLDYKVGRPWGPYPKCLGCSRYGKGVLKRF